MERLRLRPPLLFALIAGSAALAAWLLAPLLVPLIISVALYALLEPVVDRLGRAGLARNASVVVVLLLLLALAALAITLVAPLLFEQLALLQQRLPAVFQSLSAALERFTAWLSERAALPAGDSQFLSIWTSRSSDWGRDLLLQLSGGFVRLTVVLVLAPLFAYFLLVDYRSLRNHLMSAVPNRQFELAWLIYYRVARQLHRYLRGVLLQSLLIALLTALGFALVGLDMWLLLGVLSGLLNLIPYVGPLMAMGLALVVAVAQGGVEPVLMASAVMVVVLAQLVDNTLIVPAVIAEAANLHPLSVIVGVIVAGNLFGFVGMVLAVPALAAARIVFVELRRGLGPGGLLEPAARS